MSNPDEFGKYYDPMEYSIDMVTDFIRDELGRDPTEEEIQLAYELICEEMNDKCEEEKDE